jgi:hypothetical protein
MKGCNNMKKLVAWALAALLAMGLTGASLAEREPVTFTHPELGEIIKVSFSHGMPMITLYGYKYYEVLDTAQTPCRNIKTSGVGDVTADSLTPEAAMAAFYASVEGRGSEPAATAAYTGAAQAYAGELAALPEAQRISALLLLSGFGGAEGYNKLKAVSGFESADTAAMAAEYRNFTADVYGTTADYRVIMFHITEPDDTFYMERYCFLRRDGVWRLHEITREYVDEYDARTHYIHGVAGSEPDDLTEVNAQLMPGLEWGMTPETAAAILHAAVNNGGVRMDNLLLYRLPAKLDCLFTGGKLSGITYTLTGGITYYAALVSLYMRYADPVEMDENNDVSWSLENFTVTLRMDNSSPVLTVTPRLAV